MRPPTHIGLVFSYGLAYCHGVLRGIKAFAETQPHWTLTLVPPEAQPLKFLRSLPLAGLIAHVFNEHLADTLRRWRKPLVNVSNMLPDPGFPRIGSDQVLIGRLATRHLLERGLWHFGFIGHPDYASAIEREVGFRQVLEAAGHQVVCYHERKALRFDPRRWPQTLNAPRYGGGYWRCRSPRACSPTTTPGGCK